MRNRIKLLQISPGVPPLVGGVEKCTYIIYKKLNKSIFDVNILVGKNRIFEKSKIPLIMCPTKGTPLNYIVAFIKFLIHIKSSDLVHFQYPNFLFPNITYGLMLLLVSKILKKPYILHIHLILKFKSKFWLKFINLYNYYFKKLLKNAKLILIPTNYSRNLLIKQIDLDSARIKTLPNGIDAQFFEIKQDKDKLDKFHKIIYLGRFSKVKNIDKLIQAVKKLQKDIYLYIYGSGEEENNLKILAKGHKNIVIKGRLQQNQMYKAYQGAKLMVLPSSNEELPITILEALAAGVPILSAELPSIKSHFKDKIFYTDGSVADLMEKIPLILKQDLKSKIIEGQQFVKQFTWERFVSRIERYYLRALR